MGAKLGYCLQINDAAINVEKETERIGHGGHTPRSIIAILSALRAVESR